MLVRTVCRTTVGVSAASAAVPNGQDDDRRGSGKGRSGGCGRTLSLARLEWPRGNAWIAVAPPRVDVSVCGGNNPRPDTPPRPDHGSGGLDGDAADGSTGSGSTVNPCRSTPGRQRAVRGQRQDGRSGAGDHGRNARARSASTRAADSGIGRAPVLLVQPVRGGGQQQVGALGEGEHRQRGAASGERRVRERNLVGQQPPRRGGGRLDAPRRARPGRSPGARRPVQRRTGRRYSTRPRTRRAGSPPRCPRGPPCRP